MCVCMGNIVTCDRDKDRSAGKVVSQCLDVFCEVLGYSTASQRIICQQNIM